MIHFILLPTLVTYVLCRPSEIVFKNEAATSLFSGKCDLIAGEVLWEEDQLCYNIGKKGPCRQNEILSINSSRKPFCLSVGPPIVAKQTASEDEVVDFDNLDCAGEWKVEYNGSCYPLLGQGPCSSDQWLVSSDDTGHTGVCVTKPCDNQTIWWPELCQCVGEDSTWSVSDICGETGDMVWSPHGEGVCTLCTHGHLPDDDGQCHQLGTVGPCQEGQLWLEESSGVGKCGSNDNQIRLLELIPDSGPRTAQNFKCYADENGKCRKSLLVRRFGDNDGGFLDWVSSFKRRSSADTCTRATCPGDHVLWTDGQCYQLASTGPCEPGHWLVLNTIVDNQPKFHCQKRRCEADQVWWSRDCSCVTLSSSDNTDVKLKSGLMSPCQETETLLISPYGDGVCAQPETLNTRIYELIPESGSSATRIKCYADELGKCRRSLGIRSRIDTSDEESNNSALVELITWLEQFQKPSEEHCEKCQDDNDAVDVIDVDVFVNALENTTETECHREGKVLFEDGECYNLLERGPCFDQSMWLIMTVEADGSMVAQCRPRQCAHETSVWDPVTCQCYQESQCEGSDQVYLDIFGQAMCADTSDGEDTTKLETVEESVTRQTVTNNTNLDIIRATPDNCVITTSGQCSLVKVSIEKDSDKAQQFKNWLHSFLIRSPTTFKCLDE